jgi:hypothetical protein
MFTKFVMHFRARFRPTAWLLAGLILGAALTFALQALAQEGGPTYDPRLDVNHDGAINTQDIQSTAGAWNTLGDPQLVNLTARGYYQTSATFTGSQALTACTSGYHMATLAEIFDTSALRYAREIPGAVQGADSGFGPPYSITGWIRTGVGSGTNNQVGAGNCQVWTSNNAAHFGTTVALNPDWLGAVTNISPWAGVTFTCNSARRVWCVQD